MTPQTTEVPHPLPPTPHIEETEKSSVVRNVLVTFALVLLGILLGVLASRFVPTAPAVVAPAEPTIEPIQELTPMETPIPEPTATSAALLSLKWNMMTVKSPLTAFKSYRIYYPTTWSIKEYKNVPKTGELGSSTLTLMKGNINIEIIQSDAHYADCVYPGEPDIEGLFDRYGDFKSLLKNDNFMWRWAQQELPSAAVTPVYRICENNSEGKFVSSTALGQIKITSNTVIDEILGDEVNYILEKIVILP